MSPNDADSSTDIGPMRRMMRWVVDHGERPDVVELRERQRKVRIAWGHELDGSDFGIVKA